MNYQKIDMTSYNLHLIKTDRFKTINIRVCFKDEIKKDEVTIRNLLSSFLTYSTDKYPTKRELFLKTEDLYSANVYTKSYRNGRYSMINFYLSILNPKYTMESMLEESIEFLSEVIFKPNFNNQEKFQAAYDYLLTAMEKNMNAIKENPTSYSVIRMLESINDNMPYNYRDFGYVEDLKNIDKDKLISYYKKVLNSSMVDIYIIGDFDNDKVVELITKYFDFSTFKRKKVDQLIVHDKLPQKIKTVKEKTLGNQSKLTIGCKIGKLSEFERNYVLTIYNMILGGSSESKFFQIIREKHSLAYYVYSSLNKLDSLMIIKSGISKENFDKTVKLVKQLMKEVEQGKFSVDDINIAKESYLSMLNEILDNENAIIDTYLAKDLLNLGDIEERKKEIMKVSKEDIVKVSKKVKIDTIFLLEGVDEIEGN